MNEHLIMVAVFSMASFALFGTARNLYRKGYIDALLVFFLAIVLFGSAVDELMIFIGGI